MPTHRLAFILATASVLTACETPPPAALPAPPPTAPAPAPPPPPTSAPETTAAPPAGPASPEQQRRAAEIVRRAIDLLESGEEAAAKLELQRALALDPRQALATKLLGHIDADPVELLGKRFYNYTVAPNDTLSRIAERHLNDRYAFYILARYNGIKVPRQVASGQVLRIPGISPPSPPPPAPPPAKPTTPTTTPPPPAPPESPFRNLPGVQTTPAAPPSPPKTPPAPPPTPGEAAFRAGEAAERAGNLEQAVTDYERAAGLSHPGAAAKAESAHRQLASKYTASARDAVNKQDLAGAIRLWGQVLEHDPGNKTATIELQRAVDRKKKLDELPK